MAVIFLFIVSYKVSGSPREFNNDLLNDVGSLEVQGYEVHEKLSDRKEQGLPHFVTATNHGRSSSSQESGGSSSSGQTGEQKIITVTDNIGAYETSSRGVAPGNLVVGKEIINIVNRKTNSHATPYNSVLSDSIKHSIGDDATFTHKPIIVRSLTLSEVDNGSHRTLPEEHYTGRQLSAGVSNVKEEGLSASSPPALKAQHDNDGRIRYREIVRQPYYSSSDSQVAMGSVENSGSSFARVGERKHALHTTVSPKVLMDHSPTSVIKYNTSLVDIQRGMQGEYSRIDGNVNEKGLPVSYPISLKAQHNIDSDRIRYRESVRQPSYFVENNGSPYSSVDEEEPVLHTTVFPKVYQNPTIVTHDENLSAIDVKRGTQGEYSRNDEYHSSFGSQVETGFGENNGSPYSSVEEKEPVLHTTLSQSIHTNPTSVTHDEPSVIDVKRGTQGEYSSNNSNQDMFKTKKSSSNSMLSSGTQHYLEHSATGERVNQFPSQLQFILDPNIFERYPSSDGEYFFNHNGFPHPFLSTQFGQQSYDSRPPSNFHNQPTLHHAEHSLRSSSMKGSSPVEEHDKAVLDRGILNQNLYFPSSLENGGFSFSGIPFIRPTSSILSYPREEDDFGLSEGIF